MNKRELALSDFKDVDHNSWYNHLSPAEKEDLKRQIWQRECPLGIHLAKESQSCTRCREDQEGEEAKSLETLVDGIGKINEAADQIYHQECCCFHCAALEDATSNPDCACDSGPFYNRDGCKACPKGSWCDVPKEPQTYPHDDACQCFKCREEGASHTPACRDLAN